MICPDKYPGNVKLFSHRAAVIILLLVLFLFYNNDSEHNWLWGLCFCFCPSEAGLGVFICNVPSIAPDYDANSVCSKDDGHTLKPPTFPSLLKPPLTSGMECEEINRGGRWKYLWVSPDLFSRDTHCLAWLSNPGFDSEDFFNSYSTVWDLRGRTKQLARVKNRYWTYRFI